VGGKDKDVGGGGGKQSVNSESFRTGLGRLNCGEGVPGKDQSREKELSHPRDEV